MHQKDKELSGRTKRTKLTAREALLTPQVSAHFLDVLRSINGPLAVF
jgi:hypothetical protein